MNTPEASSNSIISSPALVDQIKLEPSWKAALHPYFNSGKFKAVKDHLSNLKKSGITFFPPGSQIFRAFDLAPLSSIKVVIVGQDPYHGYKQANGLCFSVNPGIELPPSLRNIYAELYQDLGIPPASHGDLTHWAQQGVLLLNSVLTVNRGEAASHQGVGWEDFTDEVINILNTQTKNTVFILWGNYAHKKGAKIDPNQHLILKAAHPSPLSANRGGFFGCKVFSKANVYLTESGRTPIDWNLE